MAVLAASVGQRVSDVAKEMVRVRAVIEPRPYRFARFHESYIRLVEELARRGWLQSAVLEHAKRRAEIEQ